MIRPIGNPLDTATTDRDERLGEAIEAYLALAESGDPPAPDEYVARYPDLVDDLLAALDGLALIRGLVGSHSGIQGTGPKLEPGRHLAGYRIVRELGRGGMGVVYEAVHVGLDRPVALKVLGAHAAPDSTARRRFLNEARTAAGLHHTHIVPVFDVGQVGGLCYYAMQRIEGSGLDAVLKTLRRAKSGNGSGGGLGSSGSSWSRARTWVQSRIARAQPPRITVGSTATWHASPDLSQPNLGLSGTGGLLALGPPGRAGDDDDAVRFEPPQGADRYRWVAEVGRQAALALSYAHQRGTIHRDIKPSNLLIDGRGNTWIADFGLARREADPGLTRSDNLLGTPRYMSPEQAKGVVLDPRTDIYSLGATLYEMLALRPPFDGKTAAELARQIGEREPTSPRAFDRRIPRDLETIVLKAMAKRPADRYANATELAEDMARFLRFEPVRARRISPVGRAWRLARRHPVPALISTAAALAVIATATFAYLRVADERDAVKQANEVTRAALREQLLSEAKLLRISSNVPDRRDKILRLLRDAVSYGPDANLKARLRDEAVQSLAVRDIEEKKSGLPAGWARSLAFGPMGERLAVLAPELDRLTVWDVGRRESLGRIDLSSGGSNGDARIFSRFTSGPRLALAGHLAVAVQADGRGLRYVDIFAGIDQGELPIKPGPNHYITGILPTAGGNRLVTIESIGGFGGGRLPSHWQVNLWDLDRPERPVAKLAEWDLEAGVRGSMTFVSPLVALSPDGEIVATALSMRDSSVALWSARDGSSLGEPIAAQVNLTALALGPDGLLAAAGGGTVRLWDIGPPGGPGRPTVLPNLNTHVAPNVVMMRFHPHGAMLALTGFERGIEVWDVAAASLVAVLPSAERVADLAFTPDGGTLAVGLAPPFGAPMGRGAGPGMPPSPTQDPAPTPTVALYSVTEPIGRVRLPEFDETPTSLAFGDQGQLAIGLRNGRIRIWNGGPCPAAMSTLESLTASALAFDGQGRFLTLSSQGLVRTRLQEESLTQAPSVPGPKTSGSDQAASARPESPDGRRQPISLSVTGDRRLAVSSHGSDFWIHDLTSDQDAILSASRIQPSFGFSRPGGDRQNGDGPRGRPPGYQMPWARSIALTPDGRKLFLHGFSGDFQVWAPSRFGDPARRSWAPQRWVPRTGITAMALSPDGKILALGDGAGQVSLLNAERDETLLKIGPTFDSPTTAAEKVTSLAFNGNGTELAVGGREHVRLWRIRRNPDHSLVVSRSLDLPGHRSEVRTLAYDREGRRLATGGDKAVEVWDLGRVRKVLASLGLEETVVSE